MAVGLVIWAPILSLVWYILVFGQLPDESLKTTVCFICIVAVIAPLAASCTSSCDRILGWIVEERKGEYFFLYIASYLYITLALILLCSCLPILLFKLFFVLAVLIDC